MKTPYQSTSLLCACAGFLAAAACSFAGTPVVDTRSAGTPSTGDGLRSGPYIGLDAGVNIGGALTLSGPVGGVSSARITLDPGFRIDSSYGYAWKIADKVSLALELEVGVIFNSLKSISGSAYGFRVVNASTGGGEYVQVPVLANVILNWEFAPHWILSGGGGAGYDFGFLSANSTGNAIGASSQFAWQALGGLHYQFSHNWDVSVGYKYLSSQPSGLKAQANQGILLGFTFRY